MKEVRRVCICFLIAVALCFSIMCAVIVPLRTAKADEIPTQAESTEIVEEIPETEDKIPTTDEVIDSMGGNLTEEDKEAIKGLIAKLKEYTDSSDSFFVRNIIPIVVAGVLCMVLGMLMFVPWLKNKFKLKSMQKAVNNASLTIQEKDKEIAELKANTDTEKIKADIKAYMHEEIKIFSGLIQQSLTVESSELSKIDAVLVALLNGAINAWQGSPEAVACLTKVVNAEVLSNALNENAKLKTYIVEKFGEEALKEINSL